MIKLKCSLCGREQIIKKRLDRETYLDLTTSAALLCGTNKCREKSDYKPPKGYVIHSGVLGSWEVVKLMTIEDYKARKRAKDILRRGLEQKRREEKKD